MNSIPEFANKVISILDFRPGMLKSQLSYGIQKKFKEQGVEIPFPQRDIPIKEEPPARPVQE